MEENKESRNVVIVGGGAAGASAAARLRRLDENARIVIIEKSPDVSVAACGMPYYIGGEITDRSRMALHTPATLGALINVEVLSGTEAIAIDRQRKHLRVRDLASGAESHISYDTLVLATGAAPLRPDLPGINDTRIMVLRTLGDMDGIRQTAEKARDVVVVGAGFIGLEMAEQLKHGNRNVTVVEMAPQVLPPLDPDMARPVQKALEDEGIPVLTNDAVTAFVDEGVQLTCQLKSGNTLFADLVILAAGVRPDTAMAKDAQLELSSRGHLVVNEWLQTSDPAIYAAGDAVELFDRQTGARSALPMGGPANRQGRAIADHIAGLPNARPYPGHLGTAIVRVFDVVAAITGHSEKRLAAANIPYRRTLVSDFQHASYYPGAVSLSLKILWSPEDGRLLGAQAIGPDGVDKRIDILSTAITGKLTIDDLAELELCYAPPFGSARDVVNTAGFAAQNQRNGLIQPLDEIPENVCIVDVRPSEMAALSPVSGALAIPLPQLRKRIGEIPRDKPILTVCAYGKTSYFAGRILQQNGYDHVFSLAGGVKSLPTTSTPSDPTKMNTTPPISTPPAPGTCHTAAAGPACGTPAPEAMLIDACGIACPGPILKVKEATDTLLDGQLLIVKANDPGFTRDIEAYAKSNHLLLESCTKENGIITARLRRCNASHMAAAANAQIGGARKGASIVVFSGDWDKVMGALVIANGAAAMGGSVTMFFTFWGLNALRKEHSVEVKGKTFMDTMFGWMMPRGIGKLGLSKMNMGGIGNPMMSWRMKQLNLPNPHSLMEAAKKGGIRIVACSMAMEAMGIKKEELLDGIEIGGVADFLGSAENSGTNLFI